MATVKAHLASMHERSADSCNAQADHDDALAECAKSAGRQQEGLHHQAKAADMRKLAGYHAEHAKNMKADAADEDLSKLATSGGEELRKMIQSMVETEVQTALSKTIMPDRVSTIPRGDVPSQGFGITAVVRPGQPDLGGVDKSMVPPQFKHLVELDDEV